ncbi:molybdopterin molybdotransferase MoeA [Terrihabitans sp. B22-R8]|uniref:molybdopterin molybdotransferase MoeA n=1 Tax=Terrihabitans sp. B22-R8 TaxID=3425128 RepID=UPI00403D34EA
MAQLSGECFAYGGQSLSIEEGIALIGRSIVPVADVEAVVLADADHRVLAGDVIAPVDIPGFDNSAVDGWAVRHSDLRSDGETILSVAARIAAGDGASHRVGEGEGARIFTGARMPEGADTVFMQEDVREEEGRVVLPPGLSMGANRRVTGEDVARGSAVLPAGLRLAPQHVALASALGFQELPVRRRLRVALLATGDELTLPGRPLAAGGLYESNRAMMAALLRRAGCEVSDLGIFRDEPGALADAIRDAASSHDLILSSGGVSIGEEDHTRRVVERIGTLVQWRLAIKPGRPVTMAVVEGTPFVGLPGNPVAVFVTFTNIVRALIARLGGEDWAPAPLMPVRAAFAYRKKAGRREFVRVILRRGADGVARVEKHPREGSGALTSLTETSGMVELAEDMTEVRAGDVVGYRSYSEMF